MKHDFSRFLRRFARPFWFLMVMVSANQLGAADQNFHVFLCLGQSNMEGFPGIPAQEKEGVDPRFQVLAAVDFPELGRTVAKWYPAVPPSCRPNTGLSPSDYFGRAMVAKLPQEAKVGVVLVAVGGCKIELFDPATEKSYVQNAPTWMRSALAAYDGSPYQRLLAMAKKAQLTGVIRGILLHQGESNVGDERWPVKVKAVYESLLRDLGLQARDVPLIAGEVVGVDQGGVAAGANALIAKLPDVIPTAQVVSSRGCEVLPDHLHFSPAGYRTLGERYADVVIEQLRERGAVGDSLR